jgi:hypothetical protein
LINYVNYVVPHRRRANHIVIKAETAWTSIEVYPLSGDKLICEEMEERYINQ